jgi:geranylgeranyl pyrophosphate synthase
MVCISNEFWREQVMAVDFKRRLLLLPHCLKHMDGCPAEYDEYGLDCKKCGACSIADYKTKAEELGYKVLVAEGTPIVLKIIVSGHVDAVVGVACLNVLEKAIDKVLKVGIPSIAVPLLSSDCKNTSVDSDWVAEVIALRSQPPKTRTRSFVPLMRSTAAMFESPELERLAPRARLKDAGDPVAGTEQIAYGYLGFGGKRFRPFITLAAYDALKGGSAVAAADASEIAIPDEVRRTALAIETFHKASLVHDDIEDGDVQRYGRETLHRRHGLATAINAGDYLIGLGYRLAARDRKTLGAEAAADVLNKLSEAHTRLSEGQGAELLWRDAADKTLTPLDALKIYALKTAPAFEAALYAGIRLAGPADKYEQAVAAFCRNLGVAFQIANDLQDWQEGAAGKGFAGGDVLGARPTVLLALAAESATVEQKRLMHEALHGARGNGHGGGNGHDGNGRGEASSAVLDRVRAVFEATGVFDKAEQLIEKYKEKAEAVADEVEPDSLRELLYFLVDTVLDREPRQEPMPPAPRVLLPVAGR